MVKPKPKNKKLARRFENHGESYIQFITTPDVDPTNNIAEQAIRFVVIDRHVTQGLRRVPLGLGAGRRSTCVFGAVRIDVSQRIQILVLPKTLPFLVQLF